MTRSAAPTQRGQAEPAVGEHRDRAAQPGDRGQHVPGDAGAAHAADDDRPGTALAGEPGQAGLGGQHDRLAHLGRAGGDRQQHPLGVAGARRGAVVEVQRHGHRGGRASSTSSTGMSSRTG